MDRRKFMLATLAGATALHGGELMAAGQAKGFEVVEADLAAARRAMGAGGLGAKRLVQAYLARIRAIDQSGPRINSVIELNPDALAIAEALDREARAKGAGGRGPLHGMPVLIKDNIATADRMQTTAGSLALVGARPVRDAFLVARLRAAGAVILGKTNLSEWANLRSTRSTSGWSARGGLTRNPYALDRNPSGSSSGAGAAMAASLAMLAVGTETDGSIVSPSNANGVVGLKPTVGLVSRAGIIPISASQDTAGPMTRSVADAAALLSVLAGSDPADPATREADQRRDDYTRHLDPDGLQGRRLGVVRGNFGGRNDLASAVIERELEVLKARGATLIDVPEIPNAAKLGAHEIEVLLHEFKAGLADYLAQYTPSFPRKVLADFIVFNEANRATEMTWFGQEFFHRAEAKGGLDSKEYLEALAACRRLSREEGIDKVLGEAKLDALVAPTGAPAWLTDFVRGDHSGSGFSTAAAVAGYPHLTVPAGFVFGLPVGLSFVGPAWSEGRLIAMGYAYEQATKHRRAPRYLKTVGLKDSEAGYANLPKK